MRPVGCFVAVFAALVLIGCGRGLADIPAVVGASSTSTAQTRSATSGSAPAASASKARALVTPPIQDKPIPPHFTNQGLDFMGWGMITHSGPGWQGTLGNTTYNLLAGTMEHSEGGVLAVVAIGDDFPPTQEQWEVPLAVSGAPQIASVSTAGVVTITTSTGQQTEYDVVTRKFVTVCVSPPLAPSPAEPPASSTTSPSNPTGAERSPSPPTTAIRVPAPAIPLPHPPYSPGEPHPLSGAVPAAPIQSAVDSSGLCANPTGAFRVENGWQITPTLQIWGGYFQSSGQPCQRPL